MSIGCDIVGDTGLQFFGKMTTSISHEIKNVLAIINENAGLMNDLMIVADRGGVLDEERVKTLVGKVSDQIRRADGIVKNMNRFAHSVDDPVKSLDIYEHMSFVVKLSQRLATMRGVRLETENPPVGLKITTSPFHLTHLVYLCLDCAMGATGEKKTVSLVIHESKDGAQIELRKLEALEGLPENVFPTERENALLELLKARLDIDASAGTLSLTLPNNIGSK